MEKHHDQNISFSEKVVSHTFIDELGKVVSSMYAEIQRWKQTTTNIDKPLSKLGNASEYDGKYAASFTFGWNRHFIEKGGK